MIALSDVPQVFAHVIYDTVGATLSTESADAVEFSRDDPHVHIRFIEHQHVEQADTPLGWRATTPYLHVRVSLGVGVITPFTDELDGLLAPLIAQHGGHVGSLETALMQDADGWEVGVRVDLCTNLTDPSPEELQATLALLQQEAPQAWDALNSKTLPEPHPAPVLREWLLEALPRHFDSVTEHDDGSLTLVQRQREGEWAALVWADLRHIEPDQAVPTLTIQVPLLIHAAAEGTDRDGNVVSLVDYVARHGSYTLGHLVVSPSSSHTFAVSLEHVSPILALSEAQLVGRIKSMIYTVHDLIPSVRGFEGAFNVSEPEVNARQAFLNDFRFVTPYWNTRVSFDTVVVVCGVGLPYTDATLWVASKDLSGSHAEWIDEYRNALSRLTEWHSRDGLETLTFSNATPFQALAQFAHSRGVTGVFSALT